MENFKTVKALSLLLFIVFNNFILAQECPANEYHTNINEARINYNDKKFKEASEKIKLSFSENITPFGDDLDLALNTALKTNDSEWAKEIAIVLAKGGVPNRYFFKLKEFSWYNEFEENLENYSTFYQKKDKTNFENDIINLIEKDKKFTHKYHGWRLKKTEMSLEEMIEKSEDIYNSFCALVDKYGFPSSENLGYYYNKGKNRVETYNIKVLMIHICQRGELIFNNELDELFCNGSIDDVAYRALMEIYRQFENNSPGVIVEMNRRYESLSK